MKRNLIFFCAAILSGLSVSATHATNAEQVKSSFVYSTYAQTKYPLVLTMVWRVLTELEQIRLVWTTGIRFFLILHVTEEMSGQQEFLRLTQLKFGEQLAQQVEEIIAITGKPKVNLIGHSHGDQQFAMSLGSCLKSRFAYYYWCTSQRIANGRCHPEC